MWKFNDKKKTHEVHMKDTHEVLGDNCMEGSDNEEYFKVSDK